MPLRLPMASVRAFQRFRRRAGAIIRKTPKKYAIGMSAAGLALATGNRHNLTSSVMPPVENIVSGLNKRWKRWSRNQYNVTIGLIGANCLVFLAGRFHPQFLYTHFTVSPAGVLGGYRVHTLITSSFGHAQLFHIGFNMMALSSFATPVINVIGEKDFLKFYLGAGLCSSLFMISQRLLLYSIKRTPHILAYSSLGASGSVMGVVTLATYYYPNMMVSPIFLDYPVASGTAWNFIVGIDSIGALLPFFNLNFSPICHSSHLGGALAGIYFATRYDKRRPYWGRRQW